MANPVRWLQCWWRGDHVTPISCSPGRADCKNGCLHCGAYIEPHWFCERVDVKLPQEASHD